VSRAFGLGRTEVARLARNGFEAAFLPDSEKAALLREFDAFISEG
jgi:adenosine deaminase